MPPTRPTPKQNLSRIYSGLRPFIVRTIERLIEAGLVTGENTPAKARPLVHAGTHMFGGIEDTDDELLVDNLTTLAVNRSGVDIPIHSVVYIDAVGFDDDFGLSRPAVDLADTTDGAKLPPLGITRDAIPNDGEGRVTRAGRLEGLDTATGGWLVGEELYLDPATPGGMTNVIPATGTVYRIGTVLADEVGPGAPAAPEDEQQGELLVDIENLTDIVGEGPAPAPHAPTHQDGGTDELEVETQPTSATDTTFVLKPDGAGGVVFGPAPPGGAALSETWRFSTTITAADPGSGRFRLNNATQPSATELYINDVSWNGVDFGGLLDRLNEDDTIYFQEEGDSAKFHLVRLTGVPVDNTGWHTLPIAIEDSGTALSNNTNCLFIFIATGTGVLIFTKSGVYFHGGDDDVTIWRAPFACTVTNVRGYRKGGSAATINARRNGTSEHLSSDLSLGTPDVWADGGAVQNTAYVAGDSLEFRRKSATGKPAITIQVDFTKP